MCPSPLRRVVPRLALLGAILACAAPSASAAPSADDLRAERDRLGERDAALAARLGRAQADLAAERARLDDARAAYRQALEGLEDRLVGLYAAPEPSPLVGLLTGGGLADARARLDLLEAVGRRDRALVAGYRRALAELRGAEAATGRRKAALVAARQRLGVDRRLVSGRLAAAVRRERAAARAATPAAPAPLSASLSADAGLAAAAPFGLPVADVRPAATDAPEPADRGLPAELLRGRRLPGRAPRDADSGRPIDVRPSPAGPAPTRAYPGVGVVGPAAGRPLDGALPTFTAVAAWYGPGFERAVTASGEAYDPAAFSAASRTLRFGTLLRVSYGARAVTVRVNDRGPYVRGRDLDLSQAAAAALGLPGAGTVTVQILPGLARPA